MTNSNNYEGDSSIGRNDAYVNHGDAHSLNITKFERVYALGGKGMLLSLGQYSKQMKADETL